MKIFMSAVIIMIILLALLTLTIKMSKKSKFSREKNSPFECGFMAMSSARKPFSIHFFMVAMMFLIFDMEISIILPMMSTKMINLNEWLMYSTITLLILILGLIHEWNNNMLEWKK